jgi:hypothetical protein
MIGSPFERRRSDQYVSDILSYVALPRAGRSFQRVVCWAPHNFRGHKHEMCSSTFDAVTLHVRICAGGGQQWPPYRDRYIGRARTRRTAASSVAARQNPISFDAALLRDAAPKTKDRSRLAALADQLLDLGFHQQLHQLQPDGADQLAHPFSTCNNRLHSNGPRARALTPGRRASRTNQLSRSRCSAIRTSSGCSARSLLREPRHERGLREEKEMAELVISGRRCSARRRRILRLWRGRGNGDEQ